MKHKIVAVTGSRADYGLLKYTLLKLKTSDVINMTLLVTGSHLSEKYGNTQTEIEKDGFAYIPVEIPVDDDSKKGMALSTGMAVSKFAEQFSSDIPELLVVLGDRFEAFAAVVGAHLIGIPVAHISGGDVTEGAIDDALRHSMTKMSTLHFPGCAQSAKRIIQMGENPKSVFDVGEPGVENCLKTELMTRQELAENIGFDIVNNNYAVVTFHPVTKENDTAKEQLNALISAMDAFDGLHYIVTLSNADAGGREINEIWQKQQKKHTNWCVVPSLGMKRYLSALKNAEMMIGNSSSGIIEAPAMHIPTVNIGDRQKGRMMAESVICCEPHKDAIVSAMQKAMTPEFKQIAKTVVCPFGDGTTSDKIVAEIEKFLEKGSKNLKKKFYDAEFNL